MTINPTDRKTETHIFPAFLTSDQKTNVREVVLTQKAGAPDCMDFHEARMQVSSYKISGRGYKID
ncbi:hypothetical protein GS682_04930 [Nostoc sp. B(2019)]|nr:hypothetical protein [Nostoc sp. B(2019)]